MFYLHIQIRLWIPDFFMPSQTFGSRVFVTLLYRIHTKKETTKSGGEQWEKNVYFFKTYHLRSRGQEKEIAPQG